MNNHKVNVSNTIRSLQSYTEYPSVSIVMPTHRVVPDKLQDHIRLKKIVSQVREQLLKECPQQEIELVVQRLEKLVAGYDFSSSLDGVAVFVSKSYGTIIPLPFTVQEYMSIGKGFLVKDLLHSLNRSLHYYVLVLSTKLSRLFEAHNDVLREIVTPLHDSQGAPLQGFPLDYVGPSTGNHDAIGQGDLDAKYLDRRRQEYFRLIDNELGKIISEQHLPVIVCGNNEYVSAFAKCTKHARSIIAFEKTDCSSLPVGQIAHVVWPCVMEYQRHQQENFIKKFIEAEGASLQAYGIHRLWELSVEGRIDTLLIEDGLIIAGKEDSENPLHVFVHDTMKVAGSIDLVNELIERVIATQGKVVFVPSDALKSFERLGAILRY